MPSALEDKDAIREVGYVPRRRNVWYELVDDAPPAAELAAAAV